MDHVVFEFNKMYEDAKLPSRKRSTDIGYDIYAYEDVDIAPGTGEWVRTGIQIAAPKGYYFTLDGRSGMGKQGVQPFRGIIDGGYTGETSCFLFNYSQEPYMVKKGDRIAQLVAHKQIHVSFIPVPDGEDFSPEYNTRGDKGWGSSGR